MKYLRHKEKGTIYSWNQYIALNPNVEEVSEEEAFPERHIPKAQRGRKPKVSLATDVLPEEPDLTPPELAEEASRGLP
jgi:hypothetical protein